MSTGNASRPHQERWCSADCNLQVGWRPLARMRQASRTPAPSLPYQAKAPLGGQHNDEVRTEVAQGPTRVGSALGTDQAGATDSAVATDQEES